MISKININFGLNNEGRKALSYQLQSSLSSFALRSVLIAFLLSAASATHAVTIVGTNNVYQVDQGVTFTIGNNGSSDFIFNWTDPGSYSDSFSNKLDPTLRLSVGQTYTFERVSSGHNFVLLKPSFTYMTGNEQQGYYRNTSTDAFISNHTYDVAVYGGRSVFTWTPTNLDVNRDYWYTCQVANHPEMAGKITVIPEPSTLGLAAAALLGLALVKQRSRRTKGPDLSDRSGSASQS
jgi:plastocyanin